MKHELETIQMVGDADDVLAHLCTATRMGRGRVIAAALEFFMNAYVGLPGPGPQQIVDRLITERDQQGTIKDATEMAKIMAALKAAGSEHSLESGQPRDTTAGVAGAGPPGSDH